MNQNSKIEVDNKIITVVQNNEQDFICLTDMVRGDEGNDHIRNWMRNRNTVEFIGLWETLHNPSFKHVEFDTFRKQAGLNNFNLTPKKWIESTNAIGIVSKSAIFKLLLIKEFQRLKEIENNIYNLEWNVKRILSKTNYLIHTDAVKEYILPKKNYDKNNEWLVYAEEADLINVALFKCTAKDWRDVNPEKASQNLNIRDFSSINELVVLSNLENNNSLLLKQNVAKSERFKLLSEISEKQLKLLNEKDLIRSLKKTSTDIYLRNK